MTSESTAPETGTEATETTEEAPTATVESLQAEVDKWKAQSRKNEERAKANAKAQRDLDELRQQSMTEQERAVEAARAEARTEVLKEVAETRVADAFRVAAAGRGIDVDELLDGINLSRFVTDDGPDTGAISAFVEKIAPAKSDDGDPFPDLGQGARASGSAPLNGDGLVQALKNAVGAR